jgi:hypothetical protein
MQLIFKYILINNLIVIEQYKDNNLPLNKSLINWRGIAKTCCRLGLIQRVPQVSYMSLTSVCSKYCVYYHTSAELHDKCYLSLLTVGMHFNNFLKIFWANCSKRHIQKPLKKLKHWVQRTKQLKHKNWVLVE